jgi:hypothetical protein
MSPSIKFLSLLVVVALVLGAGWFMLRNNAPEPIAEIIEEVEDDPNTVDVNGVLVTQANIRDSGLKVPAGFPASIPIEQANVTESYRAVYTEHNAVQYSVSYTSVKSKDALWDMYNSYLKSEGYLAEQGTSKSQGQHIATKDGDTMSIVISTRGGSSLVQLSLLVRQ